MKRLSLIYLLLGGGGLLLLLPVFWYEKTPHSGPRVVVVAFDGMDPELTKTFLAKGVMPNLSRFLSNGGTIKSLATSLPPQSPTAWSDFITGEDARTHHIFDFLHIDSGTFFPRFSLTLTERIAPSAGPAETVQRRARRGTPFWDRLDANGMRSTLIKIPTEFPPGVGPHHLLAGLGVPDLNGGYGTALLFTADQELYNKYLKDASVEPLLLERDGGVFVSKIEPPAVVPGQQREIPIKFIPARNGRSCLVLLDSEKILLTERLWSNWIRLRFSRGPLHQSVSAFTRFYLKQGGAEPVVIAYPLQIDPTNPLVRISNPDGFSRDFYRQYGPFPTQGMPSLPKLLKNGLLDDREWLSMAIDQFHWRKETLLEMLRTNKDDLLFFYFSSTDLISHLYYRTYDPNHPQYESSRKSGIGDVIEKLYREIDEVIGGVLSRLQPGSLLVVLSDHGFAPIYRELDLNAFLVSRGYLFARSPGASQLDLLQNIDRTRSKAFGLGLNGIYLLDPSIKSQLVEDLEDLVDPGTGLHPVIKVYSTGMNKNAPLSDGVPDLIVGYRRGYRVTDDSARGAVGTVLFYDNTSPWSGDHCIDPSEVPGILVTSENIFADTPSLRTIMPAIIQWLRTKGGR